MLDYMSMQIHMFGLNGLVKELSESIKCLKR